MIKKFKAAAFGIQPKTVPQGCNPVKCATEFLDEVINDPLTGDPDLFVLTENCDRFSSFSILERDEYYAERGNAVRDFLMRVARERRCRIVYAAMRVAEDGRWRNSSQFISPEGKIEWIYDKNYLTGGEYRQGFVPGKTAEVHKCEIGRIGAAICFDLNFRELMERYAGQKPNLICFSSNYHGGLMQQVWAYFCHSWFIAAAPAGSCISDPLGEAVAVSSNYLPYAITDIHTDYKIAHLDNNRAALAALKRKYGDAVTVRIPSYLGSVLICSEHPDVSAADMVCEFEITGLDDYLAAAAKQRYHSLKGQ